MSIFYEIEFAKYILPYPEDEVHVVILFCERYYTLSLKIEDNDDRTDK